MNVIVTNATDVDVADIDFENVDSLYYLVIADKPFESNWKDLKRLCLAKFIKPHIVFIMPLVKEPICIGDFAKSYGAMISTSGVRVYA